MRNVRLWISALLVVACSVALVARESCGQESRGLEMSPMIVGSESAMANAGSACGCKTGQSPPWHGNVSATGHACRACCPAHGKFHANPCGQLAMLCPWNRGCAVLPPCFPRLHGLCVDGSMPTPRPPAMPHCRQCGAPIEGGF